MILPRIGSGVSIRTRFHSLTISVIAAARRSPPHAVRETTIFMSAPMVLRMRSLVATYQTSRLSPVSYSSPDTWAGFSAAAPKFTLNRLHQMDTARYFAMSKSLGSM